MVKIHADRQTLAKRRWRAQAEDGSDFGFDLSEPLRDGSIVFQTAEASYVLAQEPERLLAVAVHTPEEAAWVAWQIGNLHFTMALKDGKILAEDDPALRQLFLREQMHFHEVTAVFHSRMGGTGGMGHQHSAADTSHHHPHPHHHHH